MRLRLLIAAAIFTPTLALAADQQFTNGERITLQPDRAYILVRTSKRPGGALRGMTKFTPVLFRVLNPQELERAAELATQDPEHWREKVEPNVVEPLADHPYSDGDGQAVLVMSVTPGTYVVGGLAVTNWATKSTGLMVVSLCMGTVKFDARPGVLTDLGTILNVPDDEPTTIPELSGVVTGRPIGHSAETVAIRPASESSADVPRTESIPRVLANYRAVPPFPNYAGARISRLAPLAGVLDYDKDGRVIDLVAASGGAAR
jgi:hypothetical protein